MLLVVGLGNPGPGHANDRHNLGFMAVDEIVRRHGFGAPRRRFLGATQEGLVGGEKILTLMPTTFMNNSGEAVGQAVRFYKLAPDQVIVIHDEIDLAPGKMRVKRGGGAAGHNGLRSITQHIGPDYWRLRVGIGHPGDKDLVIHYVLHEFAKADSVWRDPMIDAIAEAFPLLAAGDDKGFMTRVAYLIAPPKPRAERPAPPKPADRGSRDDGV